MGSKILLFFVAVFFFVKPIKTFAQVNVQDSLALVNYYDSTYGISPWQWGQSWDLQQPVSSWIGIGIRNNRVTSITLRGGGHGGHIPSSFGNLTALESIDYLDFMMDATLPESFENLVNLTSVHFHAVLNMVPFPVALTKVPNLKEIDIEDNAFIDSLPSSIGDMTQLTSLGINNCFVNKSRIPSELGNLKKLTGLSLYNNHFYGTIPASLTDIDSLYNLDLSYNNLSGNIPDGLSNLKNLNYLSLNYNHFTFKEIEPFIKAVNGSNKTIKYLNLSPQANIPITFYHDNGKLAISPGGTLSNNTFKWYKTSVGLVATVTGDSTYTPGSTGKYYVDMTNSVVTDVTLSSDTINYDYSLPDTTTTTAQNIKGTGITYVNIGMFRLASIKPIAGDNALNGELSVTVTVEPFFPTLDSKTFVQRHYDITPVQNAENAAAIVTLYFTQEDFDKFNSVVTANNLRLPLLPTGGVDNGHIQIIQIHGTYSKMIIPNVVWNPNNNWWEISFPVTGFSSFYLTSANSVLPLTLLNFNGKKEESSVVLKWQTTDEINSREFAIQRNNGGTFNDIGNIPAQSAKGINNYAFIDKNLITGNNLYRLKMIDIDGRFTYSNVIRINFAGINASLKIYPNPVTTLLNIQVTKNKAENIYLKITDAMGKLVYQKIISVNTGSTFHSLNIEKLSAGTYYLNTTLNGQKEKVAFVKE